MAPQEDPEERSALDAAKLFLTKLLADGPVSSKHIRADAEEAVLSWRTVQRAQKGMGIDAYKGGMNKGWFWMLPSKHTKINEDGREENVVLFY